MSFQKRSMERFPIELPARIALVGEEHADAGILELTTRDISSRGAFFKASQSIAAETPVEIDLVLPLDRLREIKGKKARVRISGTVVRAEAGGFAIRFDADYQIEPLEK